MTYPPHPAAPQHETPATPFAGLVTRGVALTIDGGVALLLFAVGGVAVSLVMAALNVADFGTTASLLGAGTVWFAFLSAYFVLCWATSGQTLGMRMMGLQLVNGAGAPPSLWRSIVRYVGRALSIALLFAGYLLILVHPRRRTLHDILAGTFVVYSDVPDGVVADALRTPSGASATAGTAARRAS